MELRHPPYILKQFIDVVTQPGMAFGFDPQHGCSGLLTGKKAAVIHASAVYGPAYRAGFGRDFAGPNVADWLRFRRDRGRQHGRQAAQAAARDLSAF